MRMVGYILTSVISFLVGVIIGFMGLFAWAMSYIGKKGKSDISTRQDSNENGRSWDGNE